MATPASVRDEMGRSGREKIAARHNWNDHVLQVVRRYEEAGAKLAPVPKKG